MTNLLLLKTFYKQIVTTTIDPSHHCSKIYCI